MKLRIWKGNSSETANILFITTGITLCSIFTVPEGPYWIVDVTFHYHFLMQEKSKPFIFSYTLSGTNLKTSSSNVIVMLVECMIKKKIRETPTSSEAARLSHTLVPLIRDTWRSEVSPPKITNTLRSRWFLVASLSCGDFDLLGEGLGSLLYAARPGNRKQACWIMVLRIFEWENPT